jgi:hypothetical protein
MSEPLFLLMFRVDGPPDAPTAWAAAKVEGIGCRLTREQAEALAAQTSHERRFLVPVNAETERFAGIDGPRYPMVIPPGQTIWVWGEPLRVDMLAVLLDVADGAESPTPDTVLLPVAAVVDAALNAFEPTDAHEVETALDRLVMELGGRRASRPRTTSRLPSCWAAEGPRAQGHPRGAVGATAGRRSAQGRKLVPSATPVVTSSPWSSAFRTSSRQCS